MSVSPQRPALTPHSDPIAYANRPLEKGFDEYQAVREHVARLLIDPTASNRSVPACPAS